MPHSLVVKNLTVEFEPRVFGLSVVVVKVSAIFRTRHILSDNGGEFHDPRIGRSGRVDVSVDQFLKQAEAAFSLHKVAIFHYNINITSLEKCIIY